MSAASSVMKKILQSVMTAGASAEQAEACDEDRPVKWNLPGFTGLVRVRTTFGDLPIQSLRIRDEIRTASGVVARVEWIDKIHVDEDFLRKHSSAQPIRIPADAFGIGRPMKDMTVSPCQHVCPDAHLPSNFQPAADLCGNMQAHRLQIAGLTYYRFHCGSPATVRAEGLWVRV